MKKLILSGLLIALFAFNASARKIVTKSGKGPNGYDWVQSDKGWPNSYLTCLDPGNIGCSWSAMVIGNNGDVACDDVVAWAEARVDAGYYSGDDVEYNGLGIYVTWSYDQVLDKLVVDIREFGE